MKNVNFSFAFAPNAMVIKYMKTKNFWCNDKFNLFEPDASMFFDTSLNICDTFKIL